MKISSGFSTGYMVGQYASTSAQGTNNSTAFQSALNGASSPTANAAADKVTISAQGQAASSADSGSSKAASPTKELDAAAKALEELLTYAKKTPAQLMREKILKQMGITEDELKQMPPEKQLAIEKTIADKIKEMLENPEVAKAAEAGGNTSGTSTSAGSNSTGNSGNSGNPANPFASGASQPRGATLL